MPAATESRQASKNSILAALPKDEYERISPDLEPLQLMRGRILYGAGDTVRHAYFLLTGVLSLLSVTADGRAVEVALIGSEGAAGLFPVLTVSTSPYQIVVQATGDAVRLRADLLKEEFRRGVRFQELLLRYINALHTQVSQSAACNQFHSLEQRLCRRLLVGCDRAQSSTVYITQESISQMLGAPRSGVTAAAGTLRRKGLISYSRGTLTILDRPGLEAKACECYWMMAEELAKLQTV
jgi:CRP-like cAMP-binding protein